MRLKTADNKNAPPGVWSLLGQVVDTDPDSPTYHDNAYTVYSNWDEVMGGSATRRLLGQIYAEDNTYGDAEVSDFRILQE